MNQKKSLKKQRNKPDLINRKRTLSRLIAVQIIFQLNFLNEKNKNYIEKIKNDLIENYVLEENDEPASYKDKIDNNLLENLLILADSNFNETPEIDHEISALLKKDNTIEKIPLVILAILRLASFELRIAIDTPTKVIIDEYVDIASYFFETPQVSFTNSIIENLAKKYREKDFTLKSGSK